MPSTPQSSAPVAVPLVTTLNILSIFLWMLCFTSRQLTPAVRAFAFASTSRNRAAVSISSTSASTAANAILALSNSVTGSATGDSRSTLTSTSTSTSRLQATFSTTATLENNATDISASAPKMEYPIEMTEAERYLFDLNGFLIIRGVLSPEEVEEANAAIDRHAHEMVERSDTNLRNAKQGTRFFGHGPGRMDLGQCLEWGEEDSRVFKSILAHPRLVPVFHGILGKGYRMDHLPMILAQNAGSEGFQLHGGTVDCSSGEYNPHLAYHCHHGMIRSALLGCNVILRDHNPGDGGFCVVPGSHKSNFKMPKGMVDGEMYEEFIIQPASKAGDVILFSEGTVHGAKVRIQQQQQQQLINNNEQTQRVTKITGYRFDK
jgi:ectoine hydroxylase-related dioxygenase (phytanoyl-CoA dioxygenase family)